MALLKIITGENNPILREKSKKILKFNKNFKKFAKDMKETMLKKDGLGLAAPQVGVNKRFIIVTLNYKTENMMVVGMINPEILEFGEEMEITEEGCLSLPGIYAKVERPHRIKLQFVDMDGSIHVLELEGLNARVVQHEIDHLDAVLFVDRVKDKSKVKVGDKMEL